MRGDPVATTIGQRIRYLRERNDMTKLALARLMHVDRRTISRWEDDAAFPRSEDIARLSQIFGVSCDLIVIGKPKQQ